MANIEQTIRQAAAKYHISARILRAQLNQESGLREGQTSGAGARDIAQFIPSTAAHYGVKLGDGNPTDDIYGAAHMDADNLRQYGSWQRALSAYNSGKPDAYKDPSFAKGQTYNYVKAILGAAGGAGAHSAPRPTASQPTPGSVPQRTTNISAGTSHQADRSAAVLQWFQNRHNPQALLALAGALNSIPSDTPSQVTSAQTPAVPSEAPSGPVAASGSGVVSDPSGKRVAAWIEPILQYARQHGWQGTVASGYRSDAEQTRIYDSGVRPAAVPRSEGGSGSNHEGSAFPLGAVDVTDPQQLAAIIQQSKYRKKLIYAGAKDKVHFSHPHGGGY